MILLGQHGQRQDYRMGLEYISLAAQSCDENAPQGAYVRYLYLVSTPLELTTHDPGIRHAFSP